VESWHSISSGKTIQDALVQPLNLHQKLVVGVFLFFFFLNQNLHVRQGKGITPPMKVVLSGYLSSHGKGRMN
jgi:hypothetical protein